MPLALRVTLAIHFRGCRSGKWKGCSDEFGRFSAEFYGSDSKMLGHYPEPLWAAQDTFLEEKSSDGINRGHPSLRALLPQVPEGLGGVTITSTDVCGVHMETCPP